MISIYDDVNRLAELGVGQILDPADLNNGKGDKLPADKVFFDAIAWLQEEVPAASEYQFFTPIDPVTGAVGETQVFFAARRPDGQRIMMQIEAASIMRGPNPGSSARAALEIAFTGTFTPRKDYPGWDARHPQTICPVGDPWPEIGGQRFHFAAGADPASYPIRMMTGGADPEPYRFFINGSWLAFERINVVVRSAGFSSVIEPAWRKVA